VTDAVIKGCCVQAYESEVARWLMGESFHPGGMALTGRLGERLGLRPGLHVLDVASGRGASALFLAERFGCRVSGIDLGPANVEVAQAEAHAAGLGGLVTFQAADAERLPFEDSAFDAAICECAFCLFPDKAVAAREIARVLRPGGRLGLSDVVREGALGASFDGLAAWIACVADAQPLTTYLAILADAGLHVDWTERDDDALTEITDQVRRRLFAAEVLVSLGKLSWPSLDFRAANDLVRQARVAISEGKLGYTLISAVKSVPSSWAA